MRSLLVLALITGALLCCQRAEGAVTAMDNLLLYLTCDAFPLVDSSPMQRSNITAVGNPTLVPGLIGAGACSLNPGANTTDAFYTGTWQVADPVSVTAWFTVADANANYFMKIVSTKQMFDDPLGFEMQYNPADKMWTLIGSGADMALSSTVEIEAHRWYHVAVVANGTVGTIYLDGVDVTDASALSPAQASPGKDVIVGGSATLTELNAGGVWHGYLDEVRVYNIALAASQVQAILVEFPTASPAPSTTSTTSTSTATFTSTSTTGGNTESSTTRAASTTRAETIGLLTTSSSPNMLPLFAVLLLSAAFVLCTQ